MKKEVIEELEAQLLKTLAEISYVKNSLTIEIEENKLMSEIDSIDSFNYIIDKLLFFCKSARPHGWFGASPQKYDDLNKQDQIIENLGEAKRFINEMYNLHSSTIRYFSENGIEAILANAKTKMFFTEEEKKNYCEECLKEKGNYKIYNEMMFDTGECSSCGRTDEVLNEKIADSILEDKIENYLQKGGVRIFRNPK